MASMNDGAREAEVDAQLAAASRRIADLNDIIEMLREASSAPDVESACDALLKSAVRAVPRAEIVFVALRQPESGDLAAVVSSGLISAEFRYGRGPSGIGLWGQVERLLLPVRTDSYSSDNAFAHDEELDGACRADGVTSAICAPTIWAAMERAVSARGSQAPTTRPARRIVARSHRRRTSSSR